MLMCQLYLQYLVQQPFVLSTVDSIEQPWCASLQYSCLIGRDFRISRLHTFLKCIQSIIVVHVGASF